VSPFSESALARNSRIRNTRKQRNIYTALACVVFPAVVLVSFLPDKDKHLLHTRGRFHSLGHFVVFCVVAYVASRSARSLQARLVVFGASLVLGFGIEVAEHLVFHAAMEWKDVLADAAGVIGGTLIAILSRPDSDRSELSSSELNGSGEDPA